MKTKRQRFANRVGIVKGSDQNIKFEQSMDGSNESELHVKEEKMQPDQFNTDNAHIQARQNDMKRFLECGIRNVSRLSTDRELGAGSRASKAPIRRGKTQGQSPGPQEGPKDQDTQGGGAFGERQLPSCEAESVLQHDLKLFDKIYKNARITNASVMTARSDPFLNGLGSPRSIHDRLNSQD